MMMNRVFPSALKTLEETESVSKGIARLLFQAVSNSASTNNPAPYSSDNRSNQQSIYRPLIKSNSSPNLRSVQNNAHGLQSPRTVQEEVSSTVVAIASPSSLRRRAQSMQNMVAEAAVQPMPSVTSSTLSNRSLLARASSVVVNHLPGLFLDPAVPPVKSTATLSTMDTLRLSAEAAKEDEEDYVTHLVDAGEGHSEYVLTANGLPNLETKHSAEDEAMVLAAEKQKAASSSSSDANAAGNAGSMFTEWYAEPSSPEDDVVVLASPKSLKRRVTFSPIASVVLIPTKEEYYDAGLNDHLWWKGWEMREFKYNAYREVQNIMEIYGISHVKEAFRRMSMLPATEHKDAHHSSSHPHAHDVFGVAANTGVHTSSNSNSSSSPPSSAASLVQQFSSLPQLSRSPTTHSLSPAI